MAFSHIRNEVSSKQENRYHCRPHMVGLSKAHANNSLVMMNSLQSIVILGAHGLLMLMGSKFLINMTRPWEIKIKNDVLRPGHLYQKFLSPISP